jgi:hypothetical protein
MRKIMVLSIVMLFGQLTIGQLSGSYTIPGSYNTIADAVTALNTQGVGSGGVTFPTLTVNPITTSCNP